MTEGHSSSSTLDGAAPTEFLGQICAYFRDFLDTDFRRQKMPKRSIGIKDSRGNLIGILISKYPELADDIWRALGKPLDANRQLGVSIPRGRYRSRVNKTLLDVIERHVAALDGEDLKTLADRVKASARELREDLQNDPERYKETVLANLRNELVRIVVTPLTQRLEGSIKQEGADEFEISYDIEDELGARLVADIGEAVSAALATAIVENQFVELDDVIDDSVDAETVRRRLTTYFETFSTSDFFQELHELRSTLKLKENFELYLYIGALQHNRVSYPLFYVPLRVELQERIFRITADPQIYINKKAVEYAAQETAREIGRPVPIVIKDRILYLEENESFLKPLQALLDQWCSDLALKPAIDLASALSQKAQRSQLAITNQVYFSAFDKADESLLNDYEELLTTLASGSEIADDFIGIVQSFLTTEPADVNGDVDRDWNETPIPGRLVYQAPVPLNEEQRKILAALRHNDTRFLSIEGPPGTGKSHTITAIVFEAILNGKHVLVLSDKTEALDVVEDKLNEVLDAVRFGDDFQNPILRLGRAGNNYAGILSNQAVEAIRASHRVSSAGQDRLETQIKADEGRLSGSIAKTVACGSKIQIPRVFDVQRSEDAVGKVVGNVEELVEDDIVLGAFTSAQAICGFLSANENAVFRVLRAVYPDVSLDNLGDFLQLQGALKQIPLPRGADLDALRFFARFRLNDLKALQLFIGEYQAAKWPVFGYLFAGAKLRALDAKLGAELSPVNALNAWKSLAMIEQAHLAFSNLSAALTRSGLPNSLIDLAFQQAIEGVVSLHEDAPAISDHIGRVRQAVEARPELQDKIGLNCSSIGDWLPEASGATAKNLRDVLSHAFSYASLKTAFNEIPEFDYAGDKAKLESLYAQQLAHRLDKQVLHFADNYRNLSRSLRDVIRKKQRFPKSDFGTMQEAFPCMIAGIRDYAEYIPLEKGIFDIVIIDEASQVSIAQAFPALIRAKKLVVLGDRKQFSNVKSSMASTEINHQYANAIIDGYLTEQQGVDDNTLNRLKLFNIKTSVLEFIERIANSQAMLKKHFRGYPELISFSSKTFYQNQLQAVKIRGIPVDDVIRFSEVEHDGRAEIRKNVNSVEWEAILEELRRLAEFDDAPTVGIITPFTEQQTFIIRQLGTIKDGEELQRALKLKVMTFDSCQGEERDVIIYSLVATPLQDKLGYIFAKNLDEADEVDHALRLQRINVGFSRAKERIQFFHSMPLESYRGAIGTALRHYQTQLEIGRRRPDDMDTDANSPMEKRVLDWLYQTNFVQSLDSRVEIDAQFELGSYLKQLDPGYKHPAYRVDFLMKVQSDNGRTVSIIIEYDGFKEHFTDLEKVDAYNYEDYYRPDDVERQKVLEGYGYRFLRINRFNLGRDPVKTLDVRLSRLVRDATIEQRTHGMIDEAKKAAEGLLAGEQRHCKTCDQVRPLEDFRDPALEGRLGRKCMPCKEREIQEKAQKAAERARDATQRATSIPASSWKRGSRRRW